MTAVDINKLVGLSYPCLESNICGFSWRTNYTVFSAKYLDGAIFEPLGNPMMEGAISSFKMMGANVNDARFIAILTLKWYDLYILI